MKKIILIFVTSFISSSLFAQNEGRIGVFTTISKTTLLNKDDKAFGDYLPTVKPGLGLSAGYHFTLFKAIPMGFSAQVSYNKAGQNYNGLYQDSTSYYAYTRLNYIRIGGALQFGTNIRRQVSVALTVGANYGILTNYQDRYELIRYNNDRFIVDVKNSDVSYYDTAQTKATLSDPLYNKSDLNIFGTLGLDILLSRDIVFGFGARMDMGMSGVENTDKINLVTETNPPVSTAYSSFTNVKVKYRGPVDPLITRAKTTNQAMGVYLSLKYRIFNKEKIEFWYKEHRWDK
ncbi:MAG: hypothetical protein IPL09_01600 [Bacteroidetes bacterium]|jgi:ABC-type transport system involved in Fe-S cluster assembly fused permease/ATPase subunit|nr:hypothetical protein [Bacteroidota bacterium]MBK8328182.1 hypothetical protein [Bacteroidota bacterium]MBK9299380.1 hypothetical protein [Bacteroidota bacterium]HMT35411.1 hypothetical protein [Chitinophagaceae bacterium]